MKEGYIKLYRKMLDNPVICKDNDYFRLWVQLLLMATHKEMKVMFGNNVRNLKPGELVTGLAKLGEDANVEKHKVERILKLFESEKQIEQQTCTKGRLITVLHWEDYQIDEQQNEKQMRNERETNEKQVRTNNNVNNVINKEDNNKLLSKKAKPTLEEIKSYCLERNNNVDAEKFYDYYESNGWMVGKNKMKDWKASVRTWEKNSYVTSTKTNTNQYTTELKWDGGNGFSL